LLIAVIMTGTMAMHIFVPAMPAEAADLGASPSLIQSTITLYIVALWHDGSALPVAIVVVTSAAAGQLALHNA
jgi:hypothetical protein